MREVQIYDTTLRDGTQREGISLSLADKLKIARKLDELGIDDNTYVFFTADKGGRGTVPGGDGSRLATMPPNAPRVRVGVSGGPQPSLAWSSQSPSLSLGVKTGQWSGKGR